ncbi:MAG: DUF4245 domain-containing protein [Galbitalea sp.]
MAETGRVVAELGRPETPEETAARKAENSRAHRANQTTRISSSRSSPRSPSCCSRCSSSCGPSGNLVTSVNYRTVAAQAQPSVAQPLVAPALPRGWHSNDAELKSDTGKTVTWYVGLITPKQQFIAIEQGIKTSDTWFGSLLGKAQPTGHRTIDGIRWTVYDQRASAPDGNYQYSLAATADGSNLVLHGSADDAEFSTLAASIARFLDDHPVPTTAGPAAAGPAAAQAGGN